MKRFRLLRPDEIECRVSRVTEKGVVLLLYKTARTDADLLDETVGPEAWTNDFKLIDGTLYGGIGILTPVELCFPDGHSVTQAEFVWKWDAGTESNTEAEKGRASDAFKRAGFKFGIGRELYSAPFIFVPKNLCNITNGKCYDQFEVANIQYKDERICYLCITLKGSPVFEWGEPNNLDNPVCADCGRPIWDGKKRDGSVWKAADIATYTSAKYGKALCIDCAKKAAGR